MKEIVLYPPILETAHDIFANIAAAYLSVIIVSPLIQQNGEGQLLFILWNICLGLFFALLSIILNVYLWKHSHKLSRSSIKVWLLWVP